MFEISHISEGFFVPLFIRQVYIFFSLLYDIIVLCASVLFSSIFLMMYAHFKLGQPSENHVDPAEKLLEGNPEIRPGLLDRGLVEGILRRTVAIVPSATAIRETLVLRSDWLVRKTHVGPLCNASV